MRLSIAMTTFNGSQHVREQLDSLARQTRLPDELVVCDDASTDQTAAIVHEFAASAPFPLRLEVNPQNLGIARNFQKAISLCSGQVIFLCDQDDRWHPAKLDRFEQVFASDPEVGLVFCDANVVDGQMRPLGYTFWNRLGFSRRDQKLFELDRGFQVLLRHCFVAGATLAFRDHLRDLVLPINDVCLYDVWITMLASAVSRVRIIPEPLNDYRQHGAQAIGGKKKSWRQQYLEARAKVNADFFIARAAEYDALRDRLLSASGWAVRPRVLEQIEQKASLCRARCRMRQRWYLRWPLALHLLLTGLYHRYAHGWKTLALDLFV